MRKKSAPEIVFAQAKAASLLLIALISFALAHSPAKAAGNTPVPGLLLRYPPDFGFLEIKNPLDGDKPAFKTQAKPKLPRAGESYRDPLCGTIITCLTNPSIKNGRHEYSRFDPFNADKTLVILGPDERAIFKTETLPYNSKAPFRLLNDYDEPRWDGQKANILWFSREKALYQLDVATGKETLLKDFSSEPALKNLIRAKNVWRISMKDEGEACRQNRFWAFCIQGDASVDYRLLSIFTWDRLTDKVLGTLKLAAAEADLDWVGMSALGNWVLIGGMHDNTKFTGMTLSNLQLTRFQRLDYTTSHADPGIDLEGREVLVMQNSRTDFIDMIPLSWNTKAILENNGSYIGTGRIPLMRLFYSSDSANNLASGIHISCNFPGYCVVSSHLPAGQKALNWLDNSIALVSLSEKHARVFMLAQNINAGTEYWEETQAAITRDGKGVVWASNGGKNAGQNKVFMQYLSMPPNWTELLNK